MFMINIAAKALKVFPRSGFLTNWIFGLVMAGLVTWYAPDQWTWLPVSMLTGVVVHIVGDLITTGGVPLLWPIVIRPPKILRKCRCYAKFGGQTEPCPCRCWAGPGRSASGCC
jgi:hypothetical protein